MRKQIEKVLKSKKSTSAIAKGADLPWTTVSDLRSGKTNLDKMSLLTAEKLQKYAEELEMENAKQLLEEIKNNDVSYAIVNEDGAVYCNLGTSNIMDIYGIDGEDGHFYGVYVDTVGGQQTFVDGYFEVVELMKQSGLLQDQEENEKVKEWIESHKDVVGSTVKHPTFGMGKVTEIKDGTITIDFEDYGSKSLALNAVVESDLLEF